MTRFHGLHNWREFTGVLSPPDPSVGTGYLRLSSSFFLLCFCLFVCLFFWVGGGGGGGGGGHQVLKGHQRRKQLFCQGWLVFQLLMCSVPWLQFEVCGVSPSRHRDVRFFCCIFDVESSTSIPGSFNGRSIGVHLCLFLLWVVGTNVLQGNDLPSGSDWSAFLSIPGMWVRMVGNFCLSLQGTAAWVWVSSGM